ncbi:MAG: VOC family protein [Micromonosporaceae bacterium]
MRIRLAQIFVTDQERALAFYTGKLGFQVKTNAEYGPGARWLTVVSPDDPDGTELMLGAVDEVSGAFQRKVYDAGRPAISLESGDLGGDYERLRAAGVEFTMPPTQMPYGGTDAIFDDTCGNYVNLHQAWVNPPQA